MSLALLALALSLQLHAQGVTPTVTVTPDCDQLSEAPLDPGDSDEEASEVYPGDVTPDETAAISAAKCPTVNVVQALNVSIQQLTLTTQTIAYLTVRWEPGNTCAQAVEEDPGSTNAVLCKLTKDPKVRAMAIRHPRKDEEAYLVIKIVK